MSTSATSGPGSTDASLDVQYVMAVLKKTADTQKSQAQSLIELVKQAPPQRPGVGGTIDVYA